MVRIAPSPPKKRTPFGQYKENKSIQLVGGGVPAIRPHSHFKRGVERMNSIRKEVEYPRM